MDTKNKLINESVANDALRKLCLEYRAKHNLTQQQLADLCGLGRSSIFKIEAAKHTSQITQIKVYRIVHNDILRI